MTKTLIPSAGGSAARRPHRHNELAFTQKEALSAGLVNSKIVFDQGGLAAYEMIRQNGRTDTPPERWVMGKAVTVALARPYVRAGEAVMNAGLAKEVDPRLDRIENLQQAAKAAIDAANGDKGTYTFKETDTAYDVSSAPEQIADDDAVIRGDQAAGLTHHEPASPLLRGFGAVAPFLESGPLLMGLTVLWNVNWLNPLQNPMRWATAFVLVIVLTVAMAVTTKRAGTSHNHARQEAADGNRRAAQRHYQQRNWLLGVSAALGAIVAAAIVARGVQMLDQPTVWDVAFVILVSLVVGFALPGLAYLAKAVDGSLYSRRRGELVTWLDQVEEERRTSTEVAAAMLDESARVEQTVVLESLPQVARAIEAAVHGAVQPYEWAYIQIGVDNIALPPRPSVTGVDEDGKPCIVQSITCGLEHAPALDLQPIKDRWERITRLHGQRRELSEELEPMLAGVRRRERSNYA
jgi:hypothetical protein